MGGDVLTICSDVVQRSDTEILHIGVRRIDKFDQDWDGARLHDSLPVRFWIRMLLVGYEAGSGKITHLSVSCSTGHQLHCVELAYRSNERVA